MVRAPPDTKEREVEIMKIERIAEGYNIPIIIELLVNIATIDGGDVNYCYEFLIEWSDEDMEINTNTWIEENLLNKALGLKEEVISYKAIASYPLTYSACYGKLWEING